MSAELKVYKDMAAYYQSQMSRLAQGLGPDPAKPAPAVVKQEILNFFHSLDASKSSPSNTAQVTSSGSKGSPTSPQSPIEHLLQRNPATGHIVATPELIQRCHRAYLESLSVVAHGECIVPLSASGMEKKFEMLLKPMEFRDKRAPEDADELQAFVTIVVDSETSLDTLIELWEYADVFVGGCFAMGSAATELAEIFADNSEKLMRVIIFQREAHTQERYAERLVRALTGMAMQYRHMNKLGAASSVLMIAHQIIATFPAVIPPILSDRIYVLLLLGASTEHERREWLHMLHDQIHFTTTTLLSFNVGFIVSKLRTHPIITPTVLAEISSRLQELEQLVQTVPPDVTLFQVWLKILISCFHGELGARCGDIKRATSALGRIEQLVRDNYSRALAIILLIELRNFALHCSPCSVLIGGKEQVLCRYVIERVEMIHNEMSVVDAPNNHWTPTLAAGDHVSIAMTPDTPAQNEGKAPTIVNEGSSSSTSPNTTPTASVGPSPSHPRSPLSRRVHTPSIPTQSHNIAKPESDLSSYRIPSPSSQMHVESVESLPYVAEDGISTSAEANREILTSWSMSGNRLGTELFGSGGWFPNEEDPDLELM
jgi:hypothetical protein